MNEPISRMSDLPNALVIGAMKAGTTSICAELARHPDVFVPEQKEPNGLVRHLLGEREALRDYRNLYKGRKKQVLVDGSTGNSKVPHRPDVSRLASDLLGVSLRVIYIVRDPIKRIARHLAHDIGNGVIDCSRSMVKAQDHYVTTSAYEMQLSYWREHLPEEAILVISLEEYKSSRKDVLRRLFAHLSLPPAGVLQCDPAYENKGGERRSAYRSPLAPVLHSRAYRNLKEKIPLKVRRSLAETLLPRAKANGVNLCEKDREYAEVALSRLNKLTAPSSSEIQGVLAATKTEV